MTNPTSNQLSHLRVFVQKCQSEVKTNRISGQVWVSQSDIRMLEELERRFTVETSAPLDARGLLERFEALEGRATGALKWLYSHDPLNVIHAKDILLIALGTTGAEFTRKYRDHIIQPPAVETPREPTVSEAASFDKTLARSPRRVDQPEKASVQGFSGVPCVCGEPNTLGVTHRTDGPCFVTPYK